VQERLCGEDSFREPPPGEFVSALLKVECYAGHRADERPLRFSFVASHVTTRPASVSAPSPGTRVYEVAEVLDRWYGPDYECFKVRADDLNLYVLRHQLGDDTWSLDAFRRGTASAGIE